MTGRRWAAGSAFVLLVAVASGCSGGSDNATGPARTGPTGDVSSTTAAAVGTTEGIERDLAASQRKFTPSLTVGAAECPDGAPGGSVGASTECTVDVEGVEVPYTVTLLGSNAESEGGGENYQFHLARPLVDVTALVSTIRAQAATQLKVAPDSVTVDCGPAKVQVLDVGGRIPCTVGDGRTFRRLAAVVTDDNGSTTISEV